MSDIIIYSANKLAAAEQKSLEKYAQKEFGTDSCKFVVEPSLIAGVKLVGAGKQIEISLSDLLDSLEKSLT